MQTQERTLKIDERRLLLALLVLLVNDSEYSESARQKRIRPPICIYLVSPGALESVNRATTRNLWAGFLAQPRPPGATRGT